MKKLANFLIPEAEIDLAVYSQAAKLMGADSTMVAAQAVITDSVINGFKKVYGGLWVGGTVELSDQYLSFKPNAINNLVHKDDYSLSIPLNDITDLSHEFGFLSGIIRIRTKHGVMKMRCFGAKKVLEVINSKCSLTDK